MENPPPAMPTLTAQVKTACFMPIKLNAPSNESFDSRWAALNTQGHHMGLTKACTGRQRVFNMCLEGIVTTHDRGDPTLGIPCITLE
jgi:hypothetical protein